MNKSPHEPPPAIVTSANVSLVVPERKRPTERYDGDLPFDLDDVGFRMLSPTEHLRAQRLAEGYDTHAANKSETTKDAGNAVPVNVAHWFGDEVEAVLRNDEHHARHCPQSTVLRPQICAERGKSDLPAQHSQHYAALAAERTA